MEKAFYWFSKGESLGHPKSAARLGNLYEFGQFVTQDLEKAKKLYEKALELREYRAAYRLGLMYSFGKAVKVDKEKAFYYFKLTAEKTQSASAFFNLGACYQNGDGIQKDITTAFEHFLKAANLGHSSAMFSVGYMLEIGSGVPVDMEKAISWLEKANNPKSYTRLATFYEQGKGPIQKDLKKAEELFEKGAFTESDSWHESLWTQYFRFLRLNEMFYKAFSAIERILKMPKGANLKFEALATAFNSCSQHQDFAKIILQLLSEKKFFVV